MTDTAPPPLPLPSLALPFRSCQHRSRAFSHPDRDPLIPVEAEAAIGTVGATTARAAESEGEISHELKKGARPER